jgi:hypothetical protein
MTAKSTKKVLTCMVICIVALAICSGGLQADFNQDVAPPPQTPAPEQAQPARLTPEQLQQLLAPIALYPDALVAQILAASAYPTQIVEAERFLQENPNLTGAELASEVDKQDWDPSVKALTQFPSVLANMDKDLSWTSTLGDADLNQPADVMDAIQFLRKKAQEAGNLKTTPQQTVTTQGSNVIVQPANPEIVYVPEYDPTLVYGYPIVLWPGFYPWWVVPGPYVYFGAGFGIGPFFGFGWGWPVWGFDWFHRRVFYHGAPYVFRSHAFYDRNSYFRGNYRGYAPTYERGDRTLRGYPPPAGRPGVPVGPPRTGVPPVQPRAGVPSGRPEIGAPSRPPTGTRSGPFDGIARGGDTRGYSSRGQSSLGVPRGGGAPRGGGGSVGGARGGGHR